MIEAPLLRPGTKVKYLPNSPDAPNLVPLRFGNYYTFQRAGVVLLMHTHAEGQAHYTAVLAGRFLLTRSGVATEIAAGDVVWCGPGVPHEIDCREPGAILNGTLQL